MTYFEPVVDMGLAHVNGLGDPREGLPAPLAILAEEMRWRLYTLVRAAHRPVSREEAAASAGISRKLAAFHLDKLVTAGLLRARYDAPVEGPRMGRTPKTYEPTGTGFAISIPGRRHEVLADILIDAVRASSSGEEPLEAATRIAGAKGAEHGVRQRERLRPGRLGPERALTIICELLGAGGYEPQRESSTDVRLRNCPFHPLAARAPDVVCAVNRAYLSGVLEGLEVSTVKTASDREPGNCCVMFTGIPR